MRLQALCLALFSGSWMSFAASPAEPSNYFDEVNKRHLTIEAGSFGNTQIGIRFAGDPGSSALWMGQGQPKDKELIFARIVSEGEDRGTFFIAKISESKVEIEFKPQQKAPQDAGINGTYRRVNESKLLQLSKKEFQAADDRLQNSLRMATKNWDRKDRPALDIWKIQWPTLRQRWLNLTNSPVTPPTSTTAKQASSSEKTAKDWLHAAQATARGYYFVETLPDPKTSLDWDGEYDDLGGGHASLRLGADGKLRVSLSSYRAEGEEAATIEGTTTPDQITKGKNDELIADFSVLNPEVTDPEKQAHLRLTKFGHYLHIETQNTERYASRGWFDGIYRGSPVPPQ